MSRVVLGQGLASGGRPTAKRSCVMAAVVVAIALVGASCGGGSSKPAHPTSKRAASVNRTRWHSAAGRATPPGRQAVVSTEVTALDNDWKNIRVAPIGVSPLGPRSVVLQIGPANRGDEDTSIVGTTSRTSCSARGLGVGIGIGVVDAASRRLSLPSQTPRSRLLCSGASDHVGSSDGDN